MRFSCITSIGEGLSFNRTRYQNLTLWLVKKDKPDTVRALRPNAVGDIHLTNLHFFNPHLKLLYRLFDNRPTYNTASGDRTYTTVSSSESHQWESLQRKLPGISWPYAPGGVKQTAVIGRSRKPSAKTVPDHNFIKKTSKCFRHRIVELDIL